MLMLMLMLFSKSRKNELDFIWISELNWANNFQISQVWKATYNDLKLIQA